MRKSGASFFISLCWLGMPVWAASAASEGVQVGSPSLLRHLVPAAQLEAAGQRQYDAIQEEARARGKLLDMNQASAQRLMAIARRLYPFAAQWQASAAKWTWQLSVIDSDTVNAFCLPGGKIVFFTGLINRLHLTDDELAMVMAHEIAHVLREHGRERVGTQVLIQGLGALGAALGWGDKAGGLAGLAGRAAGAGAQLAFSRTDESEADLIGLEIAARAGYKPAAAVSLWQKMARLNQQSPPQFLSTHPSHKTRIKDLQANLPIDSAK